MTTIRVPGDAVPPIQNRLRTFDWGALTPPEVRDERPAVYDPATYGRPIITVQDDGGPSMWPVWSRVVIRCTVYANGLQTAKLYRRVATGAILAAVPSGLHVAKDGLGYTEARDPDTGADLASVTVTATVRTEVITV